MVRNSNLFLEATSFHFFGNEWEMISKWLFNVSSIGTLFDGALKVRNREHVCLNYTHLHTCFLAIFSNSGSSIWKLEIEFKLPNVGWLLVGGEKFSSGNFSNKLFVAKMATILHRRRDLQELLLLSHAPGQFRNSSQEVAEESFRKGGGY